MCLQLYVIGPHIVLTRRSTLTMQRIQQAAAASYGSSSSEPDRSAVVLLQRVSAVPLSALDAAHGSSSSASTRSQRSMPATAASPSSIQGQTSATAAPLVSQAAAAHTQGATGDAGNSGTQCNAGGTALADASVAGDAAAPPLWAMQQLAAFLRHKLQLNLFNVDIIAPDQQRQQHQQLQQSDTVTQRTGSIGAGASAGNSSSRQYLVVDVNFFPGFDKVPGAEQLFADYLASLKDAERS
jgi:hypothetical protein